MSDDTADRLHALLHDLIRQRDKPVICPFCDTVIPPVEALPSVTDGPVEYNHEKIEPFDWDSIEPIPFDDQIKPLPPADLPSGFYELGDLLERARLSVNRSRSEELPFDDAPRESDYDRED